MKGGGSITRAARLAALALLFAPAALAATTGFNLTHEEPLPFPARNQWIAPGQPAYNAAVGFVDVFSASTVQLIADPSAGPSPCDPTTATAMMLDGTSLVAEVHLRFPLAARGNTIVFDRIQLGADRTDVRGMQVGVYSGTSRTPEAAFEFGRDGKVYLYGQPVSTPSGDLRYGSVFRDQDCAAGIDHHITLEMWHNLPGGTVMVDLTTHGVGGQRLRLGPFPMSAAVRAEGVGGMYLHVPPRSGRYTADGMVCFGNAPIVTPTGSDSDGRGRRRF